MGEVRVAQLVRCLGSNEVWHAQPRCACEKPVLGKDGKCTCGTLYVIIKNKKFSGQDNKYLIRNCRCHGGVVWELYLCDNCQTSISFIDEPKDILYLEIDAPQ